MRRGKSLDRPPPREAVRTIMRRDTSEDVFHHPLLDFLQPRFRRFDQAETVATFRNPSIGVMVKFWLNYLSLPEPCIGKPAQFLVRQPQPQADIPHRRQFRQLQRGDAVGTEPHNGRVEQQAVDDTRFEYRLQQWFVPQIGGECGYIRRPVLIEHMAQPCRQHDRLGPVRRQKACKTRSNRFPLPCACAQGRCEPFRLGKFAWQIATDLRRFWCFRCSAALSRRAAPDMQCPWKNVSPG